MHYNKNPLKFVSYLWNLPFRMFGLWLSTDNALWKTKPWIRQGCYAGKGDSRVLAAASPPIKYHMAEESLWQKTEHLSLNVTWFLSCKKPPKINKKQNERWIIRDREIDLLQVGRQPRDGGREKR